MGTFLAFVMVSIGVLVPRRTSPDLPRPFATPFMPWVPILGAVICVGEMLALPRSTWARLVIWLVVGMVVYFAYGKRSAERKRARSGRHRA
jgi:basic amino acid/polyamine antiporter, APA family